MYTNTLSSRTVACHLPLKKQWNVNTVPCVVSNVMSMFCCCCSICIVSSYRIPHQHSPLHHVIGNANEDCYPQEKTRVFEKIGLNYSAFAAILIPCFIAFCCLVVLCLYLYSKHRNHGNALASSSERRRRDDSYALSRIGKDSVYCYFVTETPFGWVILIKESKRCTLHERVFRRGWLKRS